jgi:hypothetical protein
MTPEITASVIAAFTALVAVIIGPFITLRASKNQLLGSMRQAWINSLRDTIAEFCAKAYVGHGNIGALLTQDDALRHSARLARMQHMQTTRELLTKIRLLLNPNEPDHKQLYRMAATTAPLRRGRSSLTLSICWRAQAEDRE